MTRPTVIVGPGLTRPGDRPTYITTPDMYRPKRVGHTVKGPTYTTSEVSKVFFGRGESWLRRHMYSKENNTTSELTGTIEPERTKSNWRLWKLHDIELLAYALAENRVLNGRQLILTINVIELQAKLWGFLA